MLRSAQWFARDGTSYCNSSTSNLHIGNFFFLFFPISLLKVSRIGSSHREGQESNGFLYITHVSSDIIRSHSWFQIPHLHLQASFIMILCPLTHVHRFNLFALDVRKFPRGYSFYPPYSQVICLYWCPWYCLSLDVH